MKFSRIFFAAIFFVIASAFFSCKTANDGEEVLRMNISSEPDSFFPWKSASADSEALWRNIFEGLMSFDKNGKIVPCLAEKVVQSDDGLTYTFSLRKGVFFHNGKEFTSSDAEFSYKNMAGLDGFKPTSAKLGAVKSVRSNGKYEFIVEMKEANPSFLLAAISVILPEGYDGQEAHPLGTGPYEFVEYAQNQKLVLKKNENYWNKGAAAKIPNVEVYIITDESATISALQSGQLDVATMVSQANAKALKGQFVNHGFPHNLVQILGMNNKVKPFDDIRVRKAVAAAVNKKEIIDGVFGGNAIELYSNFSPVLREYYNDSLENENPFDLKKASRLLAEAGYKNGFDITITVPANYQYHMDTAQIIAAQLAKIKIRCIINPVEWATWLDQVYTKFNYEMTIIGFSGKIDPADILRRYYSTYNRNFTRFYDDDFDKNFVAATKELDHEKQVAFYKECQRILAEESPAVFIADPEQSYLAEPRVRGIAGYPLLFHNFAEWYFE